MHKAHILTFLSLSPSLQEVAVIDDQYKGEVLIGLKYIPSHGKGAKAVYGGNLQVAVKQARDLAMADRHTPTSAFVKW